MLPTLRTALVMLFGNVVRTYNWAQHRGVSGGPSPNRNCPYVGARVFFNFMSLGIKGRVQ